MERLTQRKTLLVQVTNQCTREVQGQYQSTDTEGHGHHKDKEIDKMASDAFEKNTPFFYSAGGRDVQVRIPCSETIHQCTGQNLRIDDRFNRTYTTQIVPNTSRQIVPKRQFVPNTSRQIVPKGQFVPNTSRQIVPKRQFLPNTSRQIVPKGQFVPNTGRQIVPKGQFVPVLVDKLYRKDNLYQYRVDKLYRMDNLYR